jgi:hypothetical protein
METSRQMRRRARRLQGRVRIGDLFDFGGSTLPGLLLVLTALPSVLPLPGVGNVTGVALMVMAVSIWRGQNGLSLPRRVADMQVPAAHAAKLLHIAAWLHDVARRWFGPRGQRWLSPRVWVWSAWPVAVMAVVIFLPIPLGNVMGVVSLAVLGLGHSMEDGLAVVVGWMLSVLTVVYSLALSWGVWTAGQGLLEWFVSA